jgi:ABC-type nitrate/sulfonate/bicarbonate transport system substrate-binding protein
VQATKVIGHYQGNVAAARRSWAAANRDKVIAYIRGYVKAIDWLYDRANRDEAVRILRKNLPQMPQDLAVRSYDELLDPQDGFFRQGRMDMEGLKTVLDLRNRYGKLGESLDDPMKYYDPSFHAAAMAPRP